MTENLRFPNGVTVRQAKKDAKTLASVFDIPLSEAQNLVAKKNGLDMLWSRAIEWLKVMDVPLASWHVPLCSGQELPLSVTAAAPVIVIAGVAGTGKSVFAVSLAIQHLRKCAGAEVHWVSTVEFPDMDASLPADWAADNLLQALRRRHQAQVWHHHRDLAGDLPGKGSPPGTLVVLDELGSSTSLPETLLRWTKTAQERRHIVIVCAQVMAEVIRREQMPKGICAVFHGRQFHPRSESEITINGLSHRLDTLEFKRGEFSEFAAFGEGASSTFAVRLPLPDLSQV
ncbi:TPA: hypothetical protein ACKRQV_001257 [Pseudomonas aeruginosa]